MIEVVSNVRPAAPRGPRAPGRPFAGRIARGLALSAGFFLTVSFLGAAKVRPVDRETRPSQPSATTPAAAARPATAPATKPAAASVSEQPVELAAYHPVKDQAVELMRNVAAEVSSPSLPVAVAAEAPRKVKTMRMEVTAYCPCTKCCGPAAQGITASGLSVSHNGGRFVAADTALLAFGTKLQVPGYSNAATVEVIDRGGAIKGHKLDVYFPSHQEALEWGRQVLNVTVFE